MHTLLVLFWWLLVFNKIKWKEHQKRIPFLIWALFTSILHTLCRFCDLCLSKTCMRSKTCIILTRAQQTCIYSKKINILMPKVHKTCIYSKKSKVLIVKSHQSCIYSKKSKTIKNLRLYVGLTGIDELVFVFFAFSEYMQVWWLFTIKTLIFFEYMQVLCTFGIKMLIFFEYMQVLGLFPIKTFGFFEYMQVWGASGSQNLHILKKIKSFDSEKSPNLHMLKKIKKSKNLRLYAGLTDIDELIFDFFVFFEYMQVWWLFTIKTFVFLSICRFCALLASKCWSFLSKSRFGEPQVFQTYIFATKKQKRRIDTLDMFFLFNNFPDKMFKYNEHFSTTLSMIIDTFKRGIKHKELLDRHCKAPCRDPDITLKTIKKNIRYVTVSPHKITYANFPLKAIFYLKR